MQVTTAMSDALGRYLDLTSEQMKLTASNMAMSIRLATRRRGLILSRSLRGS